MARTLMTDVLGILEDADDEFFKVRRGRDGQLVVIPRTRALAGKVVPPAPPTPAPQSPRIFLGRGGDARMAYTTDAALAITGLAQVQ